MKSMNQIPTLNSRRSTNKQVTDYQDYEDNSLATLDMKNNSKKSLQQAKLPPIPHQNGSNLNKNSNISSIQQSTAKLLMMNSSSNKHSHQQQQQNFNNSSSNATHISETTATINNSSTNFNQNSSNTRFKDKNEMSQKQQEYTGYLNNQQTGSQRQQQQQSNVLKSLQQQSKNGGLGFQSSSQMRSLSTNPSSQIKSIQDGLNNLLASSENDNYYDNGGLLDDLDTSDLNNNDKYTAQKTTDFSAKNKRLIEEKLKQSNLTTNFKENQNPLKNVQNQNLSASKNRKVFQFDDEEIFGDGLSNNDIQGHMINNLKQNQQFKVSKEQMQEIKDKMKRKKRIHFITSKIKEMQKKRTFMTAPEMMVEESDGEEQQHQPPPPVDVYQQPKQDIFDEFNEMLREVDQAHRVVTQGTDDLAEIRKMIQKTKYNINTHINTVDQLKNKLTTINEKSKGVLTSTNANQYNKVKPGKTLRNVQSQKQLPTMGKDSIVGGTIKNSQISQLSTLNSMKKLPQKSQKQSDNAYNDNINQMIFSAANDVDNAREARLQQRPHYEQETKLEIMNTLLHINGSMKEFAEDIEERMGKAFKSKAGKKYGLSEAEIELKRIKSESKGQNGGLGFSRVKESAKEIDRMAKQYISNQNGITNAKFLKKHVV
eukprot:403374257